MLLDGLADLSEVLLWCAITAFIVLTGLNAWRVIAFRHQVVDDFTDPRRAFGFFTFIAGTNVLAVRLLMAGQSAVSSTLLALAGGAWLIFGYVVPWTAVLGRTERPLVADANGTWFIWVVASQSVAVAAAALQPVAGAARIPLALPAVLAWSVGVFMYAAVGMFVSLRMMLYPLSPYDLNPPYWWRWARVPSRSWPAPASSRMSDTPMVTAARGLVAGVSVVFWVFATWLIPVLGRVP